jgi:hypothetical protein
MPISNRVALRRTQACLPEDSPQPITGREVSVRVPLANIGGIVGASYDGVTADADLHAPLLCVADVFKVASGDLSLPGKVQ